MCALVAFLHDRNSRRTPLPAPLFIVTIRTKKTPRKDPALIFRTPEKGPLILTKPPPPPDPATECKRCLSQRGSLHMNLEKPPGLEEQSADDRIGYVGVGRTDP